MLTGAGQIANNLSAIRTKAGVSAAALAETVGVSRQTIYAIEKGSYVPNTVVGLRLARALSVTVEDLFSLAEQKGQGQSRKATLLPHPEELRPGQPVQLCDVDGRLMAVRPTSATGFLPASDGVLGTLKGSAAKVHVHQAEAVFGNRLLLAGCDPAMALLARYLEPAGVHVVLFHQNSSQSLSLLKRGCIHIAGTHLQEEEPGESNVAAIQQHLPHEAVAAFSFAAWQEGLIVANGNPKKIKGVQDLVRRGMRFVNREAGAGARALLDRQLGQMRIDPNSLPGYRQTAAGHLAAAWEVKRGNADCCLASQAAAAFYGLDFVPLQSSRYDLVIRQQHLQLPAIQTLLDVMTQLPFRSELRNVAGYDTAVSGARVL